MVITFQESFNGWVTKINPARPNDDFVALYSRLERAIAYFKKADILSFNHAANQMFRQLLQQNPHLHKAHLEKDLRIAAIALTQNAIVVTRNLRDFSQVPGLPIVDWSRFFLRHSPNCQLTYWPDRPDFRSRDNRQYRESGKFWNYHRRIGHKPLRH